jgi:hypothetical protein
MSDFEKLMNYFENGYYADFIMQLFEIIAIISGVILVRKDKLGVFFLAYLVFDLSVSFGVTYIKVFSSATTYEIAVIIKITNTLIALLELCVYFYFFLNILANPTMLKTIKILRVVFISLISLSIAIHSVFFIEKYSYIANAIWTTEFLFLLPPCLAYFYELLKRDSLVNLYQRPSFWIVTGIFFYSATSIPYYTISHFLINQYNWRFTSLLFFSVPFTINFIFLSIAFLCKKKLTI